MSSIATALLFISFQNFSIVVSKTASTLRNYASKQNFVIGAAAKSAYLNDTDPELGYRTILAQQYNSLTPAFEMKWNVIHPAQNTYNFTASDKILNFAIAYKMAVRGHTLAWYSQNPNWLTQGGFTPDQLSTLLRGHIQTVVGRYRGKIAVWDVVNEAINDNGSLRSNIWSPIAGGGYNYIRQAFRDANAADPNALLFYNDYSIERAGVKADAVFKMIKKLKAEGVPIHGVGFQGHFTADWPAPSAADLRAQVKRYAAIGVVVEYTELDVRTNLTGGVDTVEAARQKATYTNVMAVCVSEPNCRGVTTWGFTTKDSWIPTYFPGYGATLPFNSNYKATTIYTVIRNALM